MHRPTLLKYIVTSKVGIYGSFSLTVSAAGMLSAITFLYWVEFCFVNGKPGKVVLTLFV